MNVTGTALTTRGLLLSRIAVVALALLSSYFVLHTISFMWGRPGSFGIGIDPATGVVNDLAPRNASKGIRIGDRVNLAAMTFNDRRYLYERMAKQVGLRMTVVAKRGGANRTAVFETADVVQTLDATIFVWAHKIVAMLFIATGIIVIWNRPNVMLWALAIFLIRTHDYLVGPFRSPAVAAPIIVSYVVLVGLGLPALIVFAARFPTGRASTTTKYWDLIAGLMFVFYLYWNAHDFIPLFTARPIGDLPQAPLTIFAASVYALVFVALCVKALTRNRSPRTGLRWIVAGYGVGILVGSVALTDLFEFVPLDSFWPLFVQQTVMLALPASVAYSVIRYRAFDLGYLANRTLVYAALVIVTASTVVIGAWIAGQFASVTAVGISMFVALLVGMVFQAQYRRVVRFVDRVFLPHRRDAAEALDRIGERLRGTGDAKRVTEEVAGALGLASVAVFARATDGGFLRRAACGWPPGTAWHLLPEEALTRSLDARASILAFPDPDDEEPPLPGSHARPRVALMLRHGGRVQGAILVGAQRNGTTLDRDTLRSLHGIFDDALVVA